nr:MAG TPA: virion morphogenesis protein [Caudoviricetes sp.]
MIVKSLKEIEYLAKHQVEIGILAIDKSLMGEDGKTTILNYAIWNEFGTSDIPARPFMRNAFDSNRGIISNLIQVAPKKVIKGEKNGKEALMEIGETIRGLIIQSIATAQGWAVPNDPKTLKIKTKNGQANNTKPLIDNRFLIKSIRYQIVNENGTIEYLSDFKDV